MLARAGLSDKEWEEAISSVWYVPLELPRECGDPVPRKILSRLVLSYSEPGGLVLDPFANSGATAVVCEELGRGYACAFDGGKRQAAAEKRIHDLDAGQG